MENDALGYQKMMRPLYYQKSKRKVTKKRIHQIIQKRDQLKVCIISLLIIVIIIILNLIKEIKAQ